MESLFLTAVENTWIHGRQKRREQKRQLRELPRAPHCSGISSQTSGTSTSPRDPSPSQNELGSKQEEQTLTVKEETEKPGGEDEVKNVEKVTCKAEDMETSTCTETEPEKDVDEGAAAGSEPAPKRPHSPGTVQHFLFQCSLKVMQEEREVVIEMHWVEGQNKDLMNQLRTYLMNSLLKAVGKP